MAFIVKDNGGEDFERLEAGMYQAVCVAVVDLGIYDSPFGKNKRCALCFETAETMKEGDNTGKPFYFTKLYSPSLSKKSNLRKDLANWRGRDFTDQELLGFDLDNILGVNCQLNLVQIEKNDKTYTNIATINPSIKGMQPIRATGQDLPDWLKEMRDKGKKYEMELNNEPQINNSVELSDDPDLPF